ncbi:MAG: CAP domain-containing protein [Bacteroidota bacterium]
MKRVFSSMLIVLCVVSGLHCKSTQPSEMPRQNLEGDELLLVELTNSERGKHRLPALRINRILVEIGRYHSFDMAEREYVSHINPDGETPTERARKFGYTYITLAENIAAGNQSVNEVFQGWMESSDHRANILSNQFTELGVGIYLGRDGQAYYTQVFGHPL